MRARNKARVHGRRARAGGKVTSNLDVVRPVTGQAPRVETVRRTISASRAVLALAALIAAVCACDVHHNEPIAECIEYASKVRACFGERAGDNLLASFAKPPAEERARAALMARCASGTAMIARSCR